MAVVSRGTHHRAVIKNTAAFRPVCGYQIGNRLMPRVAPRLLIAGGRLVAASGLALLSQLTPGSGYLAIVLPAEVLVGTGMVRSHSEKAASTAALEGSGLVQAARCSGRC